MTPNSPALLDVSSPLASGPVLDCPKVAHFIWTHTLIAPSTEPGFAPSPGGRERAAPQLSTDALNIPPYNGLATCETWTARERGRNLQAMVERCTQTVGPEAHAESPCRSTASTVAMVVLENGHYHQVRITPPPLARPWDPVDVDTMVPRDMALPDDPTPLDPGQPPHTPTPI